MSVACPRPAAVSMDCGRWWKIQNDAKSANAEGTRRSRASRHALRGACSALARHVVTMPAAQTAAKRSCRSEKAGKSAMTGAR
jgi:hypothetical protein